MLIRGTVKFFVVRQDKQYGFLEAAEYPENVFLSLKKGAAPEIAVDGRGKSFVRPVFASNPARPPRTGETLVADISLGPKGPYALWWVQAKEWDCLASTIPETEYRVSTTRKVRTSGGIVPTTQLQWWGTDVEELIKLYPVGCHELRPGKIGDLVDVEVKFEIDTGDGRGFRTCPDPRLHR